MSLKQKSNDIIDEMDMDLKIAEEELTKDFDDEEEEDAEFESDDDDEEEEVEEDKQIHRTRHGKPTPYAPKNGRAPHLHHLYANYGGEVMPYINMFDLQLSYETSDIELLYHLCERINKMIDIINAENKYINRLTDWTEKKIHKLFKHQKKFENYLLELLDEFKEEMKEEFNAFKEEINEEITDFENLVNEELNAMNEEINRFENEMKDRADAFEESMKERADAFESEMNARADAFETEVNEKLDSMDNEIKSFENEMKLRADNFENTINNEMSTFETEMRNRASEFEETIEKEQSNYENEMNTRANEFESSMNNRADNFETSVNQSINDFKTETTNEINEFESLINSTVNDFSTDWTTKLNDFETYINHHIEEFESSMDERADSFEADLKEEWNDFKNKFSEMYNEYITDISNQWNEFKNEMSEEWNTEKESLENEMNSYEETMNANYNEFKESIENYITECCENVQNEINEFEATINTMIDDFENDYNERLEETTKEEVDAKITEIVNQSIYELIQQSEEFRNAISNVVNELLEESENLKEMITDIVNNILAQSKELEEKITDIVNNILAQSEELEEKITDIASDIINKRENKNTIEGEKTLIPYSRILNNDDLFNLYCINSSFSNGYYSDDTNKVYLLCNDNSIIEYDMTNNEYFNKNELSYAYFYIDNDNIYFIDKYNDDIAISCVNNGGTYSILSPIEAQYNNEKIYWLNIFFDNANNKIYLTDNKNIYCYDCNIIEFINNTDNIINVSLLEENVKYSHIIGIVDDIIYTTTDNDKTITCYKNNNIISSIYMDISLEYGSFLANPFYILLNDNGIALNILSTDTTDLISLYYSFIDNNDYLKNFSNSELKIYIGDKYYYNEDLTYFNIVPLFFSENYCDISYNSLNIVLQCLNRVQNTYLGNANLSMTLCLHYPTELDSITLKLNNVYNLTLEMSWVTTKTKSSYYCDCDICNDNYLDNSLKIMAHANNCVYTGKIENATIDFSKRKTTSGSLVNCSTIKNISFTSCIIAITDNSLNNEDVDEGSTFDYCLFIITKASTLYDKYGFTINNTLVLDYSNIEETKRAIDSSDGNFIYLGIYG